MSTYVPVWVKRDPERFPRARLPDGEGLDILSPLAPATRDADAHAFAALMGHLRAADAEKNTVLMVQVENEVGMLPVARDYSPEATREFHERVPAELVRALQKVFVTERPATEGLARESPAGVTDPQGAALDLYRLLAGARLQNRRGLGCTVRRERRRGGGLHCLVHGAVCRIGRRGRKSGLSRTDVCEHRTQPTQQGAR